MQEPLTEKKSTIVPEFLSGGGETGQRIREYDWSSTSLGPVALWPQSLRTAVSICLSSNFPICIYWGTQHVLIYNDAWSTIPGGKHPWAIGKRGKEVWPEIWADIEPWFIDAFAGKPVGSNDQLLVMERHGYAEECFFDFTFTPIYGDSGKVEGVFNAVIETTYRVINERRNRMLQQLANRIGNLHSIEAVCRATIDVLKENKKDVPFSAIYLINNNEASLSAADFDAVQSQKKFSVNNSTGEPLQKIVHQLIQSKSSQHIKEAGKIVHDLPQGIWPEPTEEALIVPFVGVSGAISGFLTGGISPRRSLDEDYKQFLENVASALSNEINNISSLEEERRRAEALAEIDKAKTAFFTNISHEFRTPLTLMLGSLEQLLNKHDRDADEDVETLETTHRNALRLLRLVNNLLDFSRIEAGKVKAQFQLTDLAKYTVDLASTFRSAIEAAGLQFHVLCDTVVQPVYVDREMWEKIVLNLLSNAFKYTLKGSITVSLTTEGDHAVLKIKDTGVGIPEAELPKMFQRFHRVENVTGRTFEGTGIGLSLVKELVQLHGGKISVQSKVDEGSEFTVSIPTGKVHLHPGQTIEEETSYRAAIAEAFVDEAVSLIEQPLSENGKGVNKDETTVLVVDDNADMRSYIKNLLQKQFHVITASNGMDALHKLKEHSVDLVVSDVMMPIMDGIQLLKSIKGTPQTSALPVILVSARAGEEARIEGLDIGADDYLIKPFSAKELLARVHSQIAIARKRAGAVHDVYKMFDEVPFAIAALKGPDLIIDYINQYNLNVWQQTREDVWGKPLFEARPDIKAGAEAIHAEIYETGKRFSAKELPIELVADGKKQTRYFDAIIDPMRDEEGNIIGQLATSIDVTEQVLARKKVEESEKEMQRIFKQAPVAINVYEGKDFIVKSANDLQLKRWGKSEAEIINKPLFDAIPEIQGQGFEEMFAGILQTGKSVSLYESKAHTIRNGKPATIYTDAHFQPWYNELGEVKGIIVIATDVTDKIEARQEIESGREQLRLITDALPALISYVDKDQRYRFNNKSYEQWFGHSAEEIQGKTIKEVVGDKAYAVVHGYTERALSGEAVSYETKVPYKDGGERYIQANLIPHFADEKEVLGYYALITDITETKEAEKKIRESEERYATTVNASDLGLWDFDVLNQKVIAAGKMAEIYGLLSNEDYTLPVLFQSIHPDDVEGQQQLFDDILKGRLSKSFETEYRIIKNDTGETRWIRARGFAFFDEKETLYRTVGTVADVTAQKETEAALVESEERFRSMADASPVMIWTLDEAGNSTYYNRQAGEFTGHTEEDLQEGRSWQVAIHPEDIAFAAGVVSNAVGNRVPYQMECRMMRADGQWRWLLNHGTPRFGSKGEYFGFVGSSIDITERKEAEFRLRESENRFRLMADAIPEVIWVADLQGRNEFFNKRWEEFSGVPFEPSTAAEVAAAFLHPDDAPVVLSAFSEAIKTGKPMEVEQRNRSASGEYRWFLNRAKPYRDPQTGEVLKWFGIGIDIHDRKMVQKALAESEERFRIMADAAPNIVWALNPDGSQKYVNKYGLDYLGLTEQEAIDMNWAPFIHPDDLASTAAAVFDAIENRTLYSKEHRLLGHNGEYRWFLSQGVPSYYANGELYGYVGSGIDITERKNIEKQIKESEERFRTLAETLPQMIWMRRADGVIEYASENWEKYSGIKDISTAWRTMTHPDDWHDVMNAWENALKTNEPLRYEVRLKNKQGEYRWHNASGEPVRDEYGNVVKWIGALTDIHEQKTFSEKLEKEVAERTKELQRSNEDLQQFAHVASHDLKEPVRKVRTFAGRLKDEFDGELPEKAKSFIGKIEAASIRMYQMIDGVLMYSSIGAVEQEDEMVNLNDVVENVQSDLELLMTQKEATVKAKSLPTVKGSPVLLYQLFYNLVNNSLKFSKPDEKPEIKIQSEVLSKKEAMSKGLQSDKDYVEIILQDNGIGFNQNNAEHIFQTFSRLHAKDKYEGTGLGLALCKKIVERHGGIIKANGKEGEGAAFIVILPVKE